MPTTGLHNGNAEEAQPATSPLQQHQLQTNKGFKIFLVLITTLLLIFGTAQILFSKLGTVPKPPSAPKSTLSTTSSKGKAKLPSITKTLKEQDTTILRTNVGVSFEIPNHWLAWFSKNTKDKLSLELSDWGDWYATQNVVKPPTYIQVKVETYKESGTNLVAFAKKFSNKYLKKESGKRTSVNGREVLVWKGKETFSDTQRDFKQFLFRYNEHIVLVRAFSSNILGYEPQLDTLVSTIKPASRAISISPKKNPFSIENVLAAGQPPFQDFTELAVMGEKKDDTFSNSAFTYESLPAKGYSFEAIQGQRLTTVADELSGGSFIHSYLFDKNGNRIKGPLDTRIEFTAGYSGKYFLILVNFKSGTQPAFKVWVEDRNQVDFVVKIKDFKTGAEYFFPHEEGLVTVPFEKFCYLVDYNNIIAPENSNPRVYSLPGSADDFQRKAFFPEENENNRVATTYYKMDSETIILYAINEVDHIISFPDKSQLVLALTLGQSAGYIDRLFTNTQAIPDFEPQPGDPNLQSTLGEQKFLVILWNYQNDPNNKPYTKEYIQNKLFGDDPNIYSLNRYYKENSYNEAWVTGQVVGWYTAPVNNSPGCQSYNSAVLQMARDDGVDVDGFSRRIYIHPRVEACGSHASCGGNPSETTINGEIGETGLAWGEYVLSHEVGHNFTLGHANLISCGQKAIDRYSNCSVRYYWDVYSVMGMPSTYHLNAFHKEDLGFLNKENILEVTRNGIYDIHPIERLSTGKLTLKIKKPDTNEYYYLEYRQPIGFDSPMYELGTKGVQIRIGAHKPYVRWPYTYLSAESYIIDNNPPIDDNDPRDVALADGKEFHDEINKIRIKQISHSREKVTVQVTFD